MERRELLLTDMAQAFGTGSTERRTDGWYALPYEADGVGGVMLFADKYSKVPDLTVSPGLEGPYEIWMGQYVNEQFGVKPRMLAKLTGDRGFTTACATPYRMGNHKIDEFLWRTADMTGQSLTLRHPRHEKDSDIAFLRFVPIGEAEYKRRKADTVKRIFATNDIHDFMAEYDPQTTEDWMMIPDEFLDSDVESLSIEYCRIYDGLIAGEKEKHAFCRPSGRFVYDGLEKFILPEDNIYPALIRRGHENGLRMYMSLRMGAWGIEFPYGGDYFDNRFALEHPELRCEDRDGTPVARMSYAYPEVREYILGCFRDMLSYGADGISLIYTRGTPYVLFEEPVRALFMKEYPGLDCRMLPNADPRLERVRAEILNGFMRDIRALADSFDPDKKVNVHVHTSLADNLYYGLDVETWVREGLVDNIIVNNDRHWENLDADVWLDREKGLIDPAKYGAWADSAPESVTCRNVYGHLIPKEAVDEYHALTEGTGVRVFCDLQRDCVGDAKAEAERLLSMGVRDFCIWDTDDYKPWTRLWRFLSRLGHTEEITGFDITKYARTCRVNVLGGMQVGRYLPWWGG